MNFFVTLRLLVQMNYFFVESASATATATATIKKKDRKSKQKKSAEGSCEKLRGCLQVQNEHQVQIFDSTKSSEECLFLNICLHQLILLF